MPLKTTQCPEHWGISGPDKNKIEGFSAAQWEVTEALAEE